MSLAAALASAYGASPRGWAGFLSRADFIADLLYTAVPQRAASGTTATFTRATTATGQKWDEAGYLDFTALAGEAVFKGARRERNLLSATQAMSAAPWAAVVTGIATVTPTDGQSDPWGGTTAAKIVFSASNNTDVSVWRQAVSVTLGDTHMSQLYIRADVPTTLYLRRGASASFVTLNVTTEWQSLHGAAAVAASTTCNFDLTPKPDAITGTAGATVYVVGAQLSNTTGETDQTTIRPYVSVGVESAPAYHGSMVDGVKCYDTDRSGNPISTSGSYPLVGYVPWPARTNLCLQSNAFTTTWAQNGTPNPTQNVIGPDGATSAWTLTDNDGGAIENVQQAITLTAATYTYSIFVKKTVGAQTAYPTIYAYTGTTLAIATIDTTNGIATTWTAYTGFTIATGLAARCRSFDDDFWRVEMSFTGTAAVWNHLFGPTGASTATQSTGILDLTGLASHVFYGAQVELGSFASSYIATTTVAVTRNADVLTYSGGDIPNLKTLSATFRREVGVNNDGVIVCLSDGTASNFMLADAQTSTQVNFQGVKATASEWNTVASNAYVPGATSKVSWSAAANDIKMAKDGVAQTPDTNAAIPTVTQLNAGHLAGSFQLNGNVGGIYGWTRNLSQSELNAVTA